MTVPDSLLICCAGNSSAPTLGDPDMNWESAAYWNQCPNGGPWQSARKLAICGLTE